MKYEKHEDKVKLYQDISMNGFLSIYCKYKKDIEEYNKYVHQYLIDHQGTDVRHATETIYCDKINEMYLEKQKSFMSGLFSSLIIIGTFLMVLISFVSLNSFK